MKFPAENKSFTFARLSVIPALRKLSIPSGFSCRLYCDVSNFLHTVIAEFTSYYLDELSISGECPPSRAQWEEGAEDTLRIQRLHEEQQRKFHGQFLPTSNYIESSAVPTNIDVSKRPDCIDDIVAFATAICSTHSDYSRRFWSEEVQGESGDGDNRILTPSRFLVDLQARQTNDHSLRPCFLTFLASLATAKNMEYSLNGAAVVHEMLSRNNSAILDGCTHSWSTLLETLRHYVRELNPNFCVPGFDESQTRVTSGSSTAYYYLGKNNVETSETDRITNPTIKPKELGVENTEILLSHLSIMANVALHHPPTRRCILGIILPVRSQDQREIIGQHGALNILFTLSIMPLDPIVRGAVFRTLANLLSLDGLKNDEEMEDARKAAHQGWQLLDACQIVPLRMLEQFSSVRKDFDLYSGLAFPSSSLALVRIHTNISITFYNRISETNNSFIPV